MLPYAVTFVGAGLNQLVLVANHDTFPVLINSRLANKLASTDGVQSAPDGTVMLDTVHCEMTSKTHLNFLADIIDLKDATYSAGDGLVYLGEYLQTFCPFVFLALVCDRLRRP